MALSEIQIILGNLKIASDIGGALIKAESALDKAHLKLELDKLVDSLFVAKQKIRELDDVIQEKNDTIKDLQTKLKLKERTVGFLSARYYADDNGEPVGDPFCNVCWASEHQLIPLDPVAQRITILKCGKCKNEISDHLAPTNAKRYIEKQRVFMAEQGKEYQLHLTR